MTSVVERQEEQEKRLADLEEALRSRVKEKDRKIRIKVPGWLLRQSKKDGSVSAALFLGANRVARWKKAVYRDGLVYVGEQSYGYEETAVFTLQQGMRKIPITVVFEWRLLPVGGRAEEVWARAREGSGLVDSKVLGEVADALGLKNLAQLSIVRRIEQAEVDKGEKKKGGMAWIWIVLGLGVLAYIAMKFFGGSG